MQRIIKFRAWDDGYKIMRYGYPVIIKGAFSHFVEDTTGSCFGKEKSNGGYVDETMQFTGLKDKNGVDVYEGDIVKYIIDTGFDTGRDDPPSVDEQRECAEVVYWIDETTGFGPFCVTPCEDIEVIGNIYTNPQLLQEAIR